MRDGAELLKPGNQDLCEAYNGDTSRVARVEKKMPSEGALAGSLELLAAASEPVRARILCALAETELCVCELGELLDMSIPAVSHHIRVLREGGFIQRKKKGRFVFYTPTRGRAQGMVVELLRNLVQRQEMELKEVAKDGGRNARPAAAPTGRSPRLATG